MFCEQCGKKIKDNAKFCKYCGYSTGFEEDVKEEVIGMLEVRETFKVPKVGTIAGAYVTSGSIKADSGIRLIREGIVVYEGKLASLKRYQSDVKEVTNGYECGLMIDGYNDLKEQLSIMQAKIDKIYDVIIKDGGNK